MIINEWTIGPISVVSYGNGLAYTITESGPLPRSLFIQGDDAEAWRTGYDASDDCGAYLLDTLDNLTTELD